MDSRNLSFFGKVQRNVSNYAAGIQNEARDIPSAIYTWANTKKGYGTQEPFRDNKPAQAAYKKIVGEQSSKAGNNIGRQFLELGGAFLNKKGTTPYNAVGNKFYEPEQRK